MKKYFYQYIIIGIAALSFTLGTTSCTDYLDKTPDSDVDPEIAFKNFTNFQGFVEEIYNCIPNKESCYWCTTFNWGEDEIMNTGIGDTHVTAHFDLGDYRHWYDEADKGGQQSWLNRPGSNPTSTNKFDHSLAGHAWYCIRKANLGLENLDKMADATREEKNFIKGQLLFFRAWWHHQQLEWWGGLPYVDSVLPADEPLTLPRLSYQEFAQRCAEDYRAAAELLPNNWDNTTVGKKTLGKNDLRITKVCALGYLGKVLLWAASPYAVNGAQLGGLKSGATYKYDAALAAQAAQALGQAIAQVESGATPYSLAEYNYSNIYDHEAAKGSKSNFSDIFRTTGQSWRMPGSVEAIMRGPMPDINGSNWNFTKLWGPKVNNLVEHDAVIHMPSANYVNYAYGMENGEPILLADGSLNPESGFDPTHPFKDRDPRFYHDIMFDGFKFLNTTPGDAADKGFQYLEMFTGGNMVPTGNPARNADGSRTGYFCQKLVPHQCNKYDGMYNWGGSLQSYLPYMRLADIYVLYAEAGAAAQGAKYKSGCSLTAEDAINVLRDRVGAGHVAARFVADQKKFMDEVRRERACELAFEGFRWQDLQRWLLLSEYPYNVKTRQEFKRVGNYDFVNNDPRDAEVTGFSATINGQTVIVERQFSTKHYLLPLKESDVYLYSDYPQNPGW
ncbi:MAG: RagB/SusD family nutrient uptake outer membrane protein [Prevotella sp.]|nr:RagB/SusD family nutrient uptake outer membrane protein [Prevotella sp.]